jgi:O-antigen/teichoic acid export membrane protein
MAMIETNLRSGPTNPSSASRLTRGPLLMRNTVWNLLGQMFPLAVGLFAIPPIIRGLGTERFGLLTLVWMVIGYFGLFDLGLGRALTSLVAQKIGESREGELPSLISTAKLLMLGFSIAGGLVFALAAPWMVRFVLKISPVLQTEGIHSCYLLSISLPFVISTAGLRGILEAHQKFFAINLLRVPLALMTYAAPLVVLPYSPRLVPMVAVLVVGRIVGWLAHLIVCLPFLPSPTKGLQFERHSVPQLLNFGTWMTVSNIVGPIMVSMDRLVIGAFVSMQAVAYYATPYELVTKVLLLPAAVSGVLFPAFSTTLLSDPQRTPRLFARGCEVILLGVFPLLLLIVALADQGLSMWLGPEFASHSATVLRWLALGVLINSVPNVAFALIQGAGRADLTAKAHLAELFIYLAALGWLVNSHGILGAAIAWTARIAVDTVIMFALASRFLPAGAKEVRRALFKIAVCVLAFCAVWLLPFPARIVAAAVILATFAIYVWIVPLRYGHEIRRGAAALLHTED